MYEDRKGDQGWYASFCSSFWGWSEREAQDNTAPKALAENPHDQEQRQKSLVDVHDGMIDRIHRY